MRPMKTSLISRAKRVKHAFYSVAAILVFSILSFAQSNQFAVNKAQDAVRQKVVSEGGGGEVIFPRAYRPETYFVSNGQTGVRGRGNYSRNNNSSQIFSYEAVVNIRSGDVERVSYRFEESSVSLPSWVVGTFRGRNPQSRLRATVTIDVSGNVTAQYDNGGTDQGNYANGQIRFGQTLVWTIRRNGNAFRALSGGRTERFRRR